MTPVPVATVLDDQFPETGQDPPAVLTHVGTAAMRNWAGVDAALPSLLVATQRYAFPSSPATLVNAPRPMTSAPSP